MQRHDVASTLRRRCIDVMCPLGKTPYCTYIKFDCLVDIADLEETSLITLTTLLANSTDDKFMIFIHILYFSRKLTLTIHVNCFLWRQFA